MPDKSPLAEQKIATYDADSVAMSPTQIDAAIKDLDDWILSDIDGISCLTRSYSFRNFSAAMDFAMQLGNAADAADHHPRLVIEWGRVDVYWWTHRVGGLFINDFIMAARSDGLYGGADKPA